YLLDPPISVDPVVDLMLALPKVPPKGAELPPKLAKELETLPQIKLAGLEVFSANGTFASAKVQQWLLGMVEETHAELRLPVIKAVEDTRLTAAGPRLAEQLADKGCPAPEKLALVRA